MGNKRNKERKRQWEADGGAPLMRKGAGTAPANAQSHPHDGPTQAPSPHVLKKKAALDTNAAYALTAEIDIPVRPRGVRWHRSTLPVVLQRAMAMRRVQSINALNETLPGTHVVVFNLQDQVGTHGLSNASVWADKHGAYVAGALRNVSDAERGYIASHHTLELRFKCFPYPQYPILYFIFGIPVSDGQVATLESVADFSDGDLQEFALAVEEHRAFHLYLLDDAYRILKSVDVPLPGGTCAELVGVFDAASAYFNRLDKSCASFREAASRFNTEHPSAFWP